MAPVTASLTGVTRQTIDDPKLVGLLSRLSKHDVTEWSGADEAPSNTTRSVNVEELVADLENELDPKGRWRYQEQADLYEWVRPLNAIDAALSQLIHENPGLLLVAGHSSCQTATPAASSDTELKPLRKQADSLADVFSIPALALNSLRAILRFLAVLLRNATNKLVFNSVHELSDLLAAADDEICALALEALASLASPPLIHRLQAPELQQQHRTALHSTKLSDKSVHGRLVTMAKGWGSRGSGLGLVASVTADDSVCGQGSLPRHAGEVSFEFVAAPLIPSSAESNKSRPVPTKNSDGSAGGSTIPPKIISNVGLAPSRLINIHLSTDEILSSGKQGEKRRRMGSPDSEQPQRVNTGVQVTKSTAELFFQCVDRAGGRDNIPLERTFALLAEVRLARSFHSNKGRVAAVERRLRALIAVLYSNPSSDVVVGYFQAQPELCVELVDLLRPMVSTASVASTNKTTDEDAAAVAAISAVAESDVVPYEIRTLAVETLTAVVSRRDSPSGGLSKVARSTNILAELGIGKGQFLGLLPTLIRFSLGSLNSFLTHNGNSKGSSKSVDSSSKKEADATMDGSNNESEPMMVEGESDDALCVSVGLAFLEATKAPSLPRRELEERALEFVDVVLTLTYSVVSVPSGTEALTNCGLIPALVSTVALESFSRRDRTMDESYAECLLHFISAQAIQILEGAIVTHTNAHTAFHDLKGVELLCRRLHLEIEAVKRASQGEGTAEARTASPSVDVEAMDVDPPKSRGDVVASDRWTTATRRLNAARRVLLFSIVNCLTVIFHQHDSNNATTAGIALGGTQLRKPELTAALKEIMDNVSSYGGVLAALTATLLSDVMNGDPQVVHYVHSSGLGESFLRMMNGRKSEEMAEEDTEKMVTWEEPRFPASSELVVALPNVIAALALTQEGAEIVKKANPFDALLSIFCSPSFAMPRSRCLLNEMAAVVGTGLDEIMRHVSSLKPTVMTAVVRAIHRVVTQGKECSEAEEREYSRILDDGELSETRVRERSCFLSSDTENSRTCLMQYAYNIGQLLEQMLHNEEHTIPFVEAGGLDGLLELYPILVPTNVQFLTYVSCLSCPSLARLTHSTTARALNVTIMNIATNYGPHKMLKKLTELLDEQLKKLSSSASLLAADAQSNGDGGTRMEGVLNGVPNAAIHNIEHTQENARVMSHLSYFLRDIVALEWFCDLLADTIRAACQRSQDGSGWGRVDREWKKEISSKAFEALVERLGEVHRKAMSEVCRIRSEDSFDEREQQRFLGPGEAGGSAHPGIYRLRVVCPEGAVLRDGIEIDSCENVGGLELGEVIEAFDRCVNSSGVMRYRTGRGWLSEQTRGHGREPIVEVIGVSGQAMLRSHGAEAKEKGKKRIEFGVPDLRAAAACVLARLQNSQVGIMSSLGRAIVAGMGSMPLRSLLLHQGTVGSHVPDLVRITSNAIGKCFESYLSDVEKDGAVGEGAPSRRSAQQAMSLGCAVSLLYSCLFEEKRDRQIVNLPVLGALLHADGVKGVLCSTGQFGEVELDASEVTAPYVGLFGAIRSIWTFCVQDMARLKAESGATESGSRLGDVRRLSRASSASLPPTIALLRRLMSRSLVVDSQMGSVMAKMKSQDISRLLCDGDQLDADEESSSLHRSFFKPSIFASALHSNIADLLRGLWTDPALKNAPAHVVYPIVSLVGDVMNCLEEAANASPDNEGSADISRRSDPRRWMLGGDDSDGTERNGGNPVIRPPEPFEPSESTISRLLEMGFTRDHALEALEVTESNTLEVAMEYALSHPPPSPTSALRRQQQRDERRRQREASRSQTGGTEAVTSDANASAADANAADASAGSGNSTSATTADGASSSTVEPSQGTNPDHAAEEPQVPESGASGPQIAPTPGTSAESDGAGSTTAPVDTERNEENAASADGTSGSAMEDDAVESAGGTGEPMDVEGSAPEAKSDEEGKASESEAVSEQEQKERTEKALEKRSIAVAKSLLNVMKGKTVAVSTDLLVKGSLGAGDDKTGPEAEGDSEALTVVLTSFLLDVCGRYPSQRSETVLALLGRLDSFIVFDDSLASHRVVEGRARDFASYCHASALILRALPRTRPLLLRFGLVQKLLDCCTTGLIDGRKPDGMAWLTHAFILLDVMAQATAAVPEIDESVQGADAKKLGPTVSAAELDLVQGEHKAQKAELSQLAVELASALNTKTTKRKSKEGANSKSDGGAGASSDRTLDTEGVKGKTKNSKSLDEGTPKSSGFPTYLPLIPASMAERCMVLCVDFLRSHSGRTMDGHKTEDKAGIAPVPGLLHAVLLLLARVLRTHKLAGQFLRLGGADFIVSLPSASRFNGMTGLVTVILRRMLEDESTLRTAMEAEIRGTMMKLHRKKSRGLSTELEQPSVTARTFVQAITPLLCRDPGCFLKAAAVSVRLDSESGDSTQHRFTLLTQEERSKHSELLDNFLRQKSTDSNENENKGEKTNLTLAATGSARKRGRLAQKEKKGHSSRSSAKSKSPRRSSKRGSGSPRRTPKQEKRDRRSSATSDIQLNGTAANHVTSLLLSELMKSVERQRQGPTGCDLDLGGDVDAEPEAPSFLLIVDYLEIIADLVLAVPACAAAIHRFKPNRSEEKSDAHGSRHPLHVFEHALIGCPKPPKTAVSYLLHCLLPQARVPWTKSSDDDSDNGSNTKRSKHLVKKDEAFMRVKIAQTSARLLVTLVARAGEGRRRVVTDLAFALSGGQLPSSGILKDRARIQIASKGTIDDHEMWALQSWGELCSGLAAPRSSGVDHDSNYGSQQSDSSLSLEVVKLMFECGMPHALMHGLKRIRLEHPLASNTAAALLRPLEMFTRGSVVDAVRGMAEKEKDEEKKKLSNVVNKATKKDGEASSSRRATIGPSSRGEQSFSDDAMLEDGFDAETAARSARRTRTSLERSIEQQDIEEFVEGFVNRMGYEVGGDEDDDHVDDEMGGMNADEFVVDAEDGEEHVDAEEEDEGELEEDEAESGGEDAEEYESDESSQSDAEESDEDGGNDDDDDMDEEADDDEEVEDMEDDDDENNDIDDDPQVNEFFDGDVDADGPVDEVTGGIEVEEGWTRVDPGGGRSGSLFLGMRSGTSPSQGGRQRNIMLGDPTEAMVIGNILLGGDLQNSNQLDALAHVEDSLGIRLGYGTRVRVNRISSAGDGGPTTTSRRGDERHNDSSLTMNSGPVGTVAAVRQRNPPDSGYSTSNSTGRLSEPNAMEYIYGGPSSAVGGRNYGFSAADALDDGGEDGGVLHVPSSFDVHLFPGGSAASTHSRTQQFLHPLLGGVELPPVNALIPALRYFGVRSRRGASSVLTNDPESGTAALFGRAFMSDSFGHVIRVSRGAPTVMGSQATSSGAAIGAWTDDGQPLDTTAEDFGRVFEQSLTAIIRAESERATASGEADANGTPQSQEANNTQVSAGTALSNTNTAEGENTASAEAAPSDDGAATETDEITMPGGTSGEGSENLTSRSGSGGGGQDLPREGAESRTEEGAENSASAMNEDQENEGTGSEGDVVANSLAAGLTLSPNSESGAVGAGSSADQGQATSGAEQQIDGSERMAAEETNERADNNPTSTEHEAQTMETDEQASAPPPEPPSSENTADIADADLPQERNDGPSAGSTGEVTEAAVEDTPEGPETEGVSGESAQNGGPNENGLVCPPGMDLDVFNCLPIDMQREVVESHQTATSVAAQLDAASGLDPEALAALPEDMRQEVIAQEQQERRMREQTPADPSNAQEMDNASFVASLAPELREEILTTSDDAFLNSLPPNIQAEAQVLRERAAASRQRRSHDPVVEARNSETGRSTQSSSGPVSNDPSGGGETTSRKKNRTGRLKVDCDRTAIIYLPEAMEKEIGALWTSGSVKALCRLMYLLSPVRPQRLMQKLILNLCGSGELRRVLIDSFVALLNDDPKTALLALDVLGRDSEVTQESVPDIEFPPPSLIGTAPLMESESSRSGVSTFRRRHSTSSAVVAASMPSGARGSNYDDRVPPIVARRIVEAMILLSKSAPRVCFELLGGATSGGDTNLEHLLNLLKHPLYAKSSSNLEQLLGLLDAVVAPLSLLPKDIDSQDDVSQRDVEAAQGKEYVNVPRTEVAPSRLHLFCSVLRLESCKESAMIKVNTIAKRLCRVESNRTCILQELASVAQALGGDAIRDLRALSIRLQEATHLQQRHKGSSKGSAMGETMELSEQHSIDQFLGRASSSAVTLSTSTSELKLLRVLQTLHSLCGDSQDENGHRKREGNTVASKELVRILKTIELESLWEQLGGCLKFVSVLEGVAINGGEEDNSEETDGDGDGGREENDTNMAGGKRLQNSVAGLLSRFLPTIEAFFVVNGSYVVKTDGSEEASEAKDGAAAESRTDVLSSDKSTAGTEQETSPPSKEHDASCLVGGRRLIDFVSSNKVLLNALLRSNPSLIEKGLKALVQVPSCKPFLDFDVKRQWFKTQLRRQRHRRAGSLRLSIRRKHVFEDTYHQLRLRNAEEMRGRLSVTFQNEEGVDAGGLSREFFAILAKEMFNPNYALFTSTEDGCTFQPNPNSSINPDHLSYFRFVGRIVGKAVLDGYLLDAHFTRSLYKHMLQVEPTHHDMQAIDPDYYKNLKAILEYKLEDIGLDLTFSIEDYSFGRSQIIDLVPNGRKVKVTEETKAKYVSLVCHHRMTASIQEQIKAYLAGFHELVKPDLISIFTAKELELLISGMPDIDMNDLKANTEYQGFKATDQEITWFWNVMFTLSRSEKAAFLQFVTGSSKVPLNGFSDLQGMRGTQKFSIHKAGGTSGALMSAHTCFNALDLPVYKSEDETREKLLYAISEGAGAFLFA